MQQGSSTAEFQLHCRFPELQGSELYPQAEPPGALSGDAFFVIKSGTVACTVDGVGEVASLGPGDFFGEMALLNDAPRTANVIARGAVSALRLTTVRR